MYISYLPDLFNTKIKTRINTYMYLLECGRRDSQTYQVFVTPHIQLFYANNLSNYCRQEFMNIFNLNGEVFDALTI